jgi:hypothetical protein
MCLYYQNGVCHLRVFNIYIMLQTVRCAYKKQEIWVFSPVLLEDGNACVFDKIRVKIFSNNNFSFELRAHTTPFFDLLYNGLPSLQS